LRAAGPALNPAQEDHLQRVERTLERMRRLLASVRDYTSANGRLALGPVALQEVVERALETLAPAIEQRAARVAVEDLPTVVGDRDQLEQLLENLLSNAIKFGPRGGRTAVSASRQEGAWRIAVEDEGPGIAPENRERVFEPFRRLRETGHVPGSGLGLAICMRVARNHGGSLTIEPSPAGGSTFVFTLPDLPGGEG
jgi:signal transduction histidine kinase